jgi:hypothetical protein
MADPSPSDLEQRLAALERAVRELQARLLELEKRSMAQPEHSVDRTAVREKTVYDWQGPR